MRSILILLAVTGLVFFFNYVIFTTESPDFYIAGLIAIITAAFLTLLCLHKSETAKLRIRY